MKKKTLKDMDVQGKRVLVRVDFNVTVQDGRVADDASDEAVITQFIDTKSLFFAVKKIVASQTALIQSSEIPMGCY